MNIVFLNPPFKGTYNREVRFQAVSPQKALHPPIILGYEAKVSINILPMMLGGIGITLILIHSIFILIQYGFGGKSKRVDGQFGN